MSVSASPRQSGLQRLLSIAGEKKVFLFLSALFAVLSCILSLAPYVVSYMALTMLLSPVFGEGQYAEILTLGLWLAGFSLARYGLMFLSLMASHIAAFDVLYTMRSRLCAHLGRLSMGYFTAQHAGRIKKILSEDVEELEHFIAHHIPDVVSGLALPLLVVIYLCTVDLRLALVALLPVPLAFVLQRMAFARGRKENFREQYHQALEELNGTIVEYVRGMPVVKIFNQTVESFTRLKTAALNYREFIDRVTLSTAPTWAVFVVVTSSGLLFLLPFGMWFYLSGSLSLPSLLLFFMLGAGYMAPLLKLALMGSQLEHLLKGLSRVDEIFAETQLPEPAKPKQPEQFSILFEEVSFSYGTGKALNKVSFAIPQGSLTALVGPSGAGKSTIGKLLLRMWDVTEGRIAIGGLDVRDMSTDELMRRVSFVFQDAFLFSDTLRENIRMGMPDATEEDIMRAAEAAQCRDFIDKMPKGLDTLVGEGGEVHLSGGEKQRVAMARVILKNAPIIVLDEATAFADAENESRIQAAFAELMRDKTVIVIAHRLSTITDADSILVIDGGGLAQQGRHEELLAQDGIYHDMWQAHIAAKTWSLQTEAASC